MQIDAVISLIDVDVCGGKVLLIVKTGAGKSHRELLHLTYEGNEEFSCRR